jgi:phospholipid/cholesterol/gamma-HCH transport system substrate-binding protein
MEAALAKLESMSGQVNGILSENRESIRGTLAAVRDLTSTVNDIAAKDRVKVERLLDGLNGTRAYADRVLYTTDQIAEQTLQMLTRNKADIQRTISNVRDATDWADKLVQKIFANPFVLSPLYKPTAADIQIQAAYDSAQIFVKGCKELNDAVATLEAMQARPMTPENKAEIDSLQRQVSEIMSRLGQASAGLAEALKPQRGPRRNIR